MRGAAYDAYLIGDIELKGGVKLLVTTGKHLIKGLGLVESAGEAVEDEALLARGTLEGLLDHADNDIVGNEASGVHDAPDLKTHRSLVLDGIAKDVARRKVADALLLLDDRSLGPLTAARRADEDDTSIGHLRALDTALNLVHELLIGNVLKTRRHGQETTEVHARGEENRAKCMREEVGQPRGNPPTNKARDIA